MQSSQHSRKEGEEPSDSLYNDTVTHSATTLTGSSSSIGSAETLFVQLDDFLSALESYIPASLRGLSLHRSGSVSFKNVGGLEEAKRTLQETLLWPSKVTILYKTVVSPCVHVFFFISLVQS